jgi:DNA-binding winged helix-turn-helix (wHTH) protein
MSDGPWTFGPFVLDAAGFRLLNGSRPVPLERRPLELLLLLVERRGELVSRGEIAARLWDADAEIDAEGSLHTVVRKLRAALGDSADQPVFIETVLGKGYRFVAAVSSTVTIAILPFEDTGGGTADEHVIDGLTEALIAAIGRVAPERLRVIARTSSMAYKHVRRTAQEIGRELGVHYLVEGRCAGTTNGGGLWRRWSGRAITCRSGARSMTAHRRIFPPWRWRWPPRSPGSRASLCRPRLDLR